MLEKARALKSRSVCVHKGLPLGPVEDYNHPEDLIKAATDFPDLTFLRLPRGPQERPRARTRLRPDRRDPLDHRVLPHAQGKPQAQQHLHGAGQPSDSWSRCSPRFARTCWARSSTPSAPTTSLWGTDSVWYGSPQMADRGLSPLPDPEQLMEKHRYRPLTSDVKARIFGATPPACSAWTSRPPQRGPARLLVGEARLPRGRRRAKPSVPWLGGRIGVVVAGSCPSFNTQTAGARSSGSCWHCRCWRSPGNGTSGSRSCSRRCKSSAACG